MSRRVDGRTSSPIKERVVALGCAGDARDLVNNDLPSLCQLSSCRSSSWFRRSHPVAAITNEVRLPTAALNLGLALHLARLRVSA